MYKSNIDCYTHNSDPYLQNYVQPQQNTRVIYNPRKQNNYFDMRVVASTSETRPLKPKPNQQSSCIKNEVVKDLRRSMRPESDHYNGRPFRTGYYCKRRNKLASNTGKFDKLLASFERKTMASSCSSLSLNRLDLKSYADNHVDYPRPRSTIEVDLLPSQGFFVRPQSYVKLKARSSHLDFPDSNNCQLRSRSATAVFRRRKKVAPTTEELGHLSDLQPELDPTATKKEQGVVKRGWVYKYDREDRSRQERIYAVLSRSALDFYNSQDTGNCDPVLRLKLSNCIGIKKTQALPDHHGFALLMVPGGAITLGALTSGIRQSWMEAIESLVIKENTTSEEEDSTSVTTIFRQSNKEDLVQELEQKIKDRDSLIEQLESKLHQRDVQMNEILREHEECSHKITQFEATIEELGKEKLEKVTSNRKSELELKKMVAELKETIKHFFQLPLKAIWDENQTLVPERHKQRFRESTLIHILDTAAKHQEDCEPKLIDYERALIKFIRLTQGDSVESEDILVSFERGIEKVESLCVDEEGGTISLISILEK
ncbi:hypothetical protein Ciccas_005909 [Cichlidogyrus casuarinus]|uniref:PH domain-containing protein n=1 Tax=Cichlidogyrus casuarinus TaxID=1844966 RepID=A0ABD2Q8F5_9PLAT